MEARRSLETSVRMRETLVLFLSTRVESTGPLWRRAGDGGAGLPRSGAGNSCQTEHIKALTPGDGQGCLWAFFLIRGKPCRCASGPCMGSAWRSAIDLRRLSPESTVHTLSHCPGFCLYAEFDLSPAHPRHVRAGNEPLSVIRSAQSLSTPGSWRGALNPVSAPVPLSVEPSGDSV